MRMVDGVGLLAIFKDVMLLTDQVVKTGARGKQPVQCVIIACQFPFCSSEAHAVLYTPIEQDRAIAMSSEAPSFNIE